MATTTAPRNVNQSSTEGVLVRDVANDMVLLEPDTTPLLVLTTNTKRKKGAKAPKFEWVEDKEVTFWAQANGTTDYASNSTQIAVADSSIFLPRDVFTVPKANSSSAAEEVCIVSSIAGNTLTIVRGIGGAGADTISATGSIRIISGAFLENDSLPTGRYQTKTTQTSACQIFRTAVAISGTQQATEIYGAPQGEETYQIAKALIRHKAEIEAAGLWSRYSETTGTQSQWTTMGLKARIATYVTDAATTLTLTNFNTFSETAFRYGAKKKLFLAAPKVLSALNYFSQNRLLTHNEDKVFGVMLQSFLSPHGTFMLTRNFRMENGIAGLNGYGDEAYCVDVESIGIRYLNGNGISRDTKLYRDVIKDGTDGTRNEVRSQLGWEIRHELRHARMFGVSAYS